MKNTRTMRVQDIIIINIPVFLALLLSLASLYFVWLFHSRPPVAIGLGIFSWQALSGAIMLIIDYRKRKIDLFFRILDSCENEVKLNLLSKPLKGTLCGQTLKLAIRNRFMYGLKNSNL